MRGVERITGAQLRAARALLGLSAGELAKATGLSRGTIQRAELETAEVTASNMARMVETLSAHGVIFIPANGGGPGVRLKEGTRPIDKVLDTTQQSYRRRRLLPRK